MKAIKALAVLGLALSLQQAQAGQVTLNFDDAPVSPVAVGSRYAALGAQFSGNNFLWDSDFAWDRPGTNGLGALLLGTDASGGSNAASSVSFTIDFAGGFLGGVDYSYSNVLAGGGLSYAVHDGLGGSGNLLGSADVKSVTGSACSSNIFFCNWRDANLQFSGVAKSITFTATDGHVLFDYLKFTTPEPTTGTVPEPAGIALVLGALAALGLTSRRQRAA